MDEQVLIERDAVGAETLRFRPLRTFLQRMRGLLGTSATAEPVALVGCTSIHTFGMRYRIDVAFVGRSGQVLDVYRSVSPGRLLSHERAWIVLERPHVRGPWLMPGESVCVRNAA